MRRLELVLGAFMVAIGIAPVFARQAVRFGDGHRRECTARPGRGVGHVPKSKRDYARGRHVPDDSRLPWGGYASGEGPGVCPGEASGNGRLRPDGGRRFRADRGGGVALRNSLHRIRHAAGWQRDGRRDQGFSRGVQYRPDRHAEQLIESKVAGVQVIENNEPGGGSPSGFAARPRSTRAANHSTSSTGCRSAPAAESRPPGATLSIS